MNKTFRSQDSDFVGFDDYISVSPLTLSRGVQESSSTSVVDEQFGLDDGNRAIPLAGGNDSSPFEGTVVGGIANSGNQNINALIFGTKWSNTISYDFPDAFADYGSYSHAISGFFQVPLQERTAVRLILEGLGGVTGKTTAGTLFGYGSYKSVANVSFSDLGSSNAADISIAGTNLFDGVNLGTARVADFPRLDQRSDSGDIWIGNDYSDYLTPRPGDYGWITHIHELGHSMGLKHGHDPGYGQFSTAMTSDRDSMEYSVMTYRSYIGAPTTNYMNETYGFAQTLMMFDIATLQYLYGANFNTNSGATTYTWNPTTGEMSLNGVGQGAPGIGSSGSSNRIFLTIWDGNGNDTYDLSNYTTNLRIDLRPGESSTFSATQLAYLGGGPNSGYARGNVFNALQYQNDSRSLIENAVGGSGNDTFTGNAADNTFRGNAGNDTIDGGIGTDSAIFAGLRSAYTLIDLGGGGVRVVGPDGTDTLSSIERLVFNDRTVVWPLVAGAGVDLTGSNVALNGITLSYKINNTGTTTSAASTTGIFLSTDSTITTSDTLLTTQAASALAGGASDVKSLLLSFPTNLTPGTYFVGVYADYFGLVAETDETNNASTAVAVVLGNTGGNALAGTTGNDTIFAFDGNDTITGLTGNDWIDGGTGDDRVVLSGNLAAYTLRDLGNRVLISGPDGNDVVYAVEHLQFANGTINYNDGDPLFDTIFYERSNADVFAAGVDAKAHYNSNGWHELRDPDPLFDTSGYLAANRDVAAAGVNPLAHYATFGWKEGRDPSFSFDNEFYLAHNPDVAAAHINPLAHYLQFGINEGRAISPAVGEAQILSNGFDPEYYLLRNEDVARAGVNPSQHYNDFGWHELRDPNGYFSTGGYLAVYSDVRAAGVNPLQHYDANGWREGRDPGANFDTEFYLLHNPDVRSANIDPLAHYLRFGIVEGRATSPEVGSVIQGGFDAQYYLFAYPDIAAAHVDPLAHYNSIGHTELRNPNAYFDAAGYLAHNPDVAAAHADPFQHYEQFGWKEGRNPSTIFDTSNYLAANPDVAAAHISPLDHFLTNGIHEGRTPSGSGLWDGLI